ncbi:hypothetical protein FSP39_022897, partial [Pinctada imbricata]
IFFAHLGLTPEGCSDGWAYFNHMCYLFSVHAVTFDEAKGICFLKSKDSTLTSVWSAEETSFITKHLLQNGIGKAWIGIEPRQNRYGWKWSDGSILDLDDRDRLPKDSTNMCGYLTKDGERRFHNCSLTIQAFVCKMPLTMVYVVSEIFNSSYNSNSLQSEPDRLLFERVWPPKLQEVDNYLIHLGPAMNHVTQETDCAYRCFRASSCRAFSLRCIIPWKCNQYSCDVYAPKI